MKLSDVSPLGGPVAAVDIVIERLYAPRYLVTVHSKEGSGRFSMSEEEYAAHQQNVQLQRDKLFHDVAQEVKRRRSGTDSTFEQLEDSVREEFHERCSSQGLDEESSKGLALSKSLRARSRSSPQPSCN